jgi:hypothetical protein
MAVASNTHYREVPFDASLLTAPAPHSPQRYPKPKPHRRIPWIHEHSRSDNALNFFQFLTRYPRRSHHSHNPIRKHNHWSEAGCKYPAAVPIAWESGCAVFVAFASGLAGFRLTDRRDWSNAKTSRGLCFHALDGWCAWGGKLSIFGDYWSRICSLGLVEVVVHIYLPVVEVELGSLQCKCDNVYQLCPRKTLL